jgi:2-hydroxychromene-2-carboxylate isomerase
VDANTNELVARGHWGVPVFDFRGELFWGQDRIEDLEVALAAAGLARGKVA